MRWKSSTPSLPASSWKTESPPRRAPSPSPGGVPRAQETIGPRRFLLDRLDEASIADMRASLDTLGEGDIRDLRAFSGTWSDPASAGQGFSIAPASDGTVAVRVFGHRDDGGKLPLAGASTQRLRCGEPNPCA